MWQYRAAAFCRDVQRFRLHLSDTRTVKLGSTSSSVKSDVASDGPFNTEKVSSARKLFALLKEGEFLCWHTFIPIWFDQSLVERYHGLGQSPGPNTHATISVRRP